MNGDDIDSFVTDPSALSEVMLVDVIADIAQGDLLDLSDLLSGLPVGEPSADSVIEAWPHGDVAGAEIGVGTMVEVASLTGVSSVISVLYDDSQPAHSETVA